jgi:Zn-finger nucleic acid-binding protein
MKCPACQGTGFEQKTLENGLQPLSCTTCNGYWIRSLQFWAWKETYKEKKAGTVSDQRAAPAIDSLARKICPECFKILSPYLVGKGTNIIIDRCETCKGVWLDKYEYDLLDNKNLLIDLHKIFSIQWQSAAKMEKIFEHRAEALKHEIGDEEYKIVDDFLQQLRISKKKKSILAYLNYVS